MSVPCLVAANCGWHWRCEEAVTAGNVTFLRDHLDVIAVLHDRAWQRCRCELYERILAMVAA